MYGEERTGLVALSFVRQLSGQTEIYAQLRHRKDEDTRRYELLRALSLDKVSTLRLVRRDETLYFFYAQPGMEDLRLLAQYNIGTEVIPLRGVRMSVHTSGEGKETVVRWKNVTIRAESVIR